MWRSNSFGCHGGAELLEGCSRGWPFLRLQRIWRLRRAVANVNFVLNDPGRAVANRVHDATPVGSPRASLFLRERCWLRHVRRRLRPGPTSRHPQYGDDAMHASPSHDHPREFEHTWFSAA